MDLKSFLKQMKRTEPPPNPLESFMVSDRIYFEYHGKKIYGYIHSKKREKAYIVGDDKKEYQVPYSFLKKVVGAEQKVVQSGLDVLKSKFHVNDVVCFKGKNQFIEGKIARMNPKRAHVIANDGREYQVSYFSLLRLQSSESAKSENRDNKELEKISHYVLEMIEKHKLSGWSFQFDNSTQRAGSCNYTYKVITLSFEYVKFASWDDVQDTILHEIAHAIVGKDNNHNAIWKAKAIEIGCSGSVYHDVQFSPPRYIIHCNNYCWVSSAERRRRNVVCNKCSQNVSYMTYTEARFKEVVKKVEQRDGDILI